MISSSESKKSGTPPIENKPGLVLPSISVPKGGGAIRGIGEKFTVSPATGTGSFSVPIFTSPGRSGFGPKLSLSYESGGGNGPFGFGWNLSLGSVTRKTSKGIPKYNDDCDSDVFILSGAEDLVPIFRKDEKGQWIRDCRGNFTHDEQEYEGYIVRQYRPRIEGLFAKIERWTNKETREIHWRSISKDNIITVYGRNNNSRIADPSNESRVFSWLMCESYDDKGNAIVYKYVQENEKGVNLSSANEQNRIRNATRYIKSIFYGNVRPILLDHTKISFRRSHLDQSDFSSVKWMFEVLFDYDEDHYRDVPLDIKAPKDDQHHYVEVSNSAGNVWRGRPDPFSTYRSGFEIRTYRRCHRVMMFHRFQELGNQPYLVRSTDFRYSDFEYSRQCPSVNDELKHKGSSRFASFIQSVTQSGYELEETRPVYRFGSGEYSTYLKKSFPSLEFEYSKAIIRTEISDLDGCSLENLPVGIEDKDYHFVDLDGEGVSGILTEQGGAWFYKPNMGEGKFGPIQQVAFSPSIADLKSGKQLLLDMAGDGQLDIVQLDDPVAGFYERTQDESWNEFVPFKYLPRISWNSPNIRFVDLTGDGLADVLITENEVFTWYQSLAEEGFRTPKMVIQDLNNENAPSLVISDRSESIYLADMSGDGLSDFVRIRNGEVCYWPNLGYGHFGRKVEMLNCPWFDNPDRFDQRSIRLADIDGSGVTDIIYLGSNGAQLYLNQSGNGWSNEFLLPGLQFDNHSSIMVTDLFGTGTASIVSSSPLEENSRRSMRYLDLMGGVKPHLLIKSTNNLGAETRIGYTSSTKYYLADKRNGKPWITRLPFPVHVVDRVDTFDYINKNYFATKYAYHHGFFDGIEREFRGFGMVEQWDTEEFTALSKNDYFPKGENIQLESHVPPVYIKTWFHTGIYPDRDRVSNFYQGFLNTEDKGEYYREPAWQNDDFEARKHLLGDTTLPEGLTIKEQVEACRALKGSMLRQEVYALDNSDKAGHPYMVVEQNFTVKVLQPMGNNEHGVFFIHGREALNYHYERNPDDPRTIHTLNLEVDEFGNILKRCEIGYGRRKRNIHPNSPLLKKDQEKQTKLLITYTEIGMTNPVVAQDAHRIPMESESRVYELTGYQPSGLDGRFLHSDFVRPNPSNPKKFVHLFDEEINYEDQPKNKRQRRLIEEVRTVYRKNNLTSLLPLGRLESLALLGNNYRLAFTSSLLNAIYRRDRVGKPTENLLLDPAIVLRNRGAGGGGYLSDKDLMRASVPEPTDQWWAPSGQIFYSPNGNDKANEELCYAVQHFFLPHRYIDPFGGTTTLTFDLYNLLLVNIQDQIGNLLTAGERDGSGTITRVGNNYRVLQPNMMTDPNRNRTMATFDALGLVVGTAVMGKSDSDHPQGDSLAGIDSNLTTSKIIDHLTNPLKDPHSVLLQATTRLIYDLFAYQRTKEQPNPHPPVVYTILRETHNSGLLHGKITEVQHIFSYSDGFGREIQKKTQAEPGQINSNLPNAKVWCTRWLGSGWTIFNNKGKPVRQYEPFFSNTHNFEFNQIVGVSPVLFYDPMDRVIAVLHPNNTFEKVLFDAWLQTTYDVNDTVASDPRSDPDVSFYFEPYFANQPASWQTWYMLRKSGALGAKEKIAAEKTLVHSDTPTTTYFDSLGRTFLILTHNGFKKSGAAELFSTRIDLDIEGNQRTIRDCIQQNGDDMGRIVVCYDYDMLGKRVHERSMERGERWTLLDVTGKPIRAWDSKGNSFRTEYDLLRRPLRSFVNSKDSDNAGLDILIERMVYGENHPEDEIRNLRGLLYLHFDQAGTVSNIEYDFKGNLLTTSRRFAQEYRKEINWTTVDDLIPSDAATKLDLVALEEALATSIHNENFISTYEYDALNRLIVQCSPHSENTLHNTICATYNKSNRLEKLNANLRMEKEDGLLLWTPIIKKIDYNEKGQRTRIEYGIGANEKNCGVVTSYEYDPLTFRLTHLVTRRNSSKFPSDYPQSPEPDCGGCNLQNLYYTYDPFGNIIGIRDNAYQRIFFRNRCVDPTSEYTYDSLYRLIEATGREHLGQVAGYPSPYSHNDAPHVGITWSANDGNAMGRFIENYVYDPVGNFLSVHHKGENPANPGWTRNYEYKEKSLIEPTKRNNRLSSTTVGSNSQIIDRYEYDNHGNMIRMPHLGGRYPDPNMEWNHRDQLCRVNLGGGGIVYYVYDSVGERVRKVWEKSENIIEEYMFLGDFDIFRRSNGERKVKQQRETLHLVDDKHRIAIVESNTVTSTRDNSEPQQLIRYQFENHLGSASLELDEHAQIISYEEYTPYGSTSYQAVRSQTEVAKRYRYTGKERDEETGLYYFGARYYPPWLGSWISCDPAGLLDSVNFYRYVRNNPVRLNDSTGTQPDDPTSTPTLSGAGLTFGAGKVRVGPLTVPPVSVCDELNPACKGWTFNLVEPQRDSNSGGSESGNNSPEDKPFDPLKALKTYSPAPAKDVIWRKTNPGVDPDPTRYGFKPKNPAAKFTPGEHALGQHLPEGSQYVSASQKPGGATNISGEPYAIDPKKIPSDTPIHDTPDILRDMEQLAKDGKISPERVEMWKRAQQTSEGVAPKPGQPLKGEVLIEGPVPPQAVESAGARALKGVGRGLFWVAVAMTVYDIGQSIRESFEQGSVKPVLRETVRQATTWGAAIGGAKLGGLIGSAFGPVGTVVGGIIGGVVGGIAGYIGGSWLASLF